MQYWRDRDRRERSEGVKQRARLVVEWVMNQAFRAAATESQKGLASARSLYLPPLTQGH